MKNMNPIPPEIIENFNKKYWAWENSREDNKEEALRELTCCLCGLLPELAIRVESFVEEFKPSIARSRHDLLWGRYDFEFCLKMHSSQLYEECFSDRDQFKSFIVKVLKVLDKEGNRIEANIDSQAEYLANLYSSLIYCVSSADRLLQYLGRFHQQHCPCNDPPGGFPIAETAATIGAAGSVLGALLTNGASSIIAGKISGRYEGEEFDKHEFLFITCALAIAIAMGHPVRKHGSTEVILGEITPRDTITGDTITHMSLEDLIKSPHKIKRPRPPRDTGKGRALS